MTEPAAGGPALAEVFTSAAVAWRLFREGHSLDRAIASAVPADARLRGPVQAITYEAVRKLALIESLIGRLAARQPEVAVQALLAVALGQLTQTRRSEYTVVDQAVRAARLSPSTVVAAGFVNAILRNFLRSRAALLQALAAHETVRFNAPSWWIDRVRGALPLEGDAVLATQGEAAPLVVRVNSARISVGGYADRLAALEGGAVQVGAQAIWIRQPRPVNQLPGFGDGLVSVQDAGAQLAAAWLAAADGMRVLDACAAPGGKTGHLVELADLDLVALEVDPARAARITGNLDRIGHRAQVLVGDARAPADWWDLRPFDRILLDAPCTASGIVRRHPDIPWLRRPGDVAQLTTVQRQLLDGLWPLLKVGGRLLYVVCSIFPDEGIEQIERFLRRTADAALVPLPVGAPFVALRPTAIPRAVPAWDPNSPLPTLHDGFFYALIEKTQ